MQHQYTIQIIQISTLYQFGSVSSKDTLDNHSTGCISAAEQPVLGCAAVCYHAYTAAVSCRLRRI